MKIYDRVEYFLSVLKSSSTRLKLRDCNGGDIYGNNDVCSYCATVELIRGNPGNEDFIAFGGMFDMETISKIINDAPEIKDHRISPSPPYKRFGLDDSKIYDSEKDREQLDKETNAFMEKHSQLPSNSNSYLKCERNGKIFYATREEYDEFKKRFCPCLLSICFRQTIYPVEFEHKPPI
jgi:hypothetical protein